MGKLIYLEVTEGNFETGFKINLRVGEEDTHPDNTSGSFPCEPNLPKLYQEWRSKYINLEYNLDFQPRGRIGQRITIGIGPQECHQAAEALKNSFRNWLGLGNSSRGLQKIREKLSKELQLSLDKQEEVRVLIQTKKDQEDHSKKDQEDHLLLKKLPWHEWDVFANQTNIEIALSPSELHRNDLSWESKSDKQVKILAIVGNSDGIDTNADCQELEKLLGVKPCFLNQPNREKITNSLWNDYWDILFFTGHSHSDNNQGKIFINKTDYLEIKDLKNGLRQARNNGLRLAIFNSCDGLKLAEDLADLGIPQVIVMRESIPDRVAQKFWKYFLRAFVEKAKSLYLAVREARDILHDEGLDQKFPGVSWLPIIYQNSTVVPLSWQELLDSRKPKQVTCADAQDFSAPSYDDFFGRKTELNELKAQLKQNKVLAIQGEPGIGKTYLASKLAALITGEYKICWIDKGERSLSLDDFLKTLNDFLKSNGEYGFDQRYSQSVIVEKHQEIRIENKDKIGALVQLIKNKKYVIFIDNFHLAKHSELEDLIDCFRTQTRDSKLVLIDRSLTQSLKTSMVSKVCTYPVIGFDKEEDARDYIVKHCQDSNLQFSEQDIEAIIKKTEGYCFAIELIIAWWDRSFGNINDILQNLVEYDKRDNGELRKKLLDDISNSLNSDEKKAVVLLSIFKVAFNWEISLRLEISREVIASLIKRRLLKKVQNQLQNQLQMHSLIAEFWRTQASEDQTLDFHLKASSYYLEQGQKSSLDCLDCSAYLQAFYHFQEIKDDEQSANTLNDLVERIHEKERIISDRLLNIKNIKDFIYHLPPNIFANKPWLLLEKGQQLETDGRFREAQKCFEESYTMFEQESNQMGQSVSLYYTAKMGILLKEIQPSLKQLLSVLEMSQSDIPMKIRTLGKICHCYEELEKYQDAENANDQSQKMAEEEEDEIGVALAVYRKASIYKKQQNFLEAEKFYDDSAKRFDQLGDKYRQSKSLMRLAICQKFQGKNKEALANYETTIDLKKTIDDQYGLGLGYDYLADIHRSSGKYKEAEKYYKKSLTIKDSLADVYGLIKTHNNLARLALLRGKLNEAENEVKESEKLTKEESNKFIGLEGSRLFVLGDIQLAKGEYEEALETYEKAKSCFTTPNPEVPRSQGLALLSMGNAHFNLGKFDQAKQNFESALKIFSKCNANPDKTRTSLHLAKLISFIDYDAAQAHNQTPNQSEKDEDQSILLLGYEIQALIEENKIVNNAFDDDKISPNDILGSIDTILNSINQWYDKAINKLKLQDNQRAIARLTLKKILWDLSIKYLYKESVKLDYAYQLLKSERLKDSLAIELINRKYLLENINSLKESKLIAPLLAKNMAELALEIMSPLAMLFGFNQLSEELADLAFAFLEPEKHQEITEEIESRFPQKERLLEELKSELEDGLNEAKINYEIQRRIKTPYSIYKKSTLRKVPLANILDIVGLRIITKTVDECYKALEIVQDLGVTFEGQGILKETLRDYIKDPKKTTGYQSIHINIQYGIDININIQYVEYGNSKPCIVEFQIRTEQMHLAAEYGGEIFGGVDPTSHRYYKNPSFYARSSSQKNYTLSQQYKFYLVVECEQQFVSSVAQIIRDSKFKLFGPDIDRSPQGKILLKLELITKSTSLSKNKNLDKYIEKITEAQEELTRKINSKDSCQVILISQDDNYPEVEQQGITLQEKQQLVKELADIAESNDRIIYLFTPKGDIKRLKADIPDRQITPIDFAYRIHHEVGNQCSMAKVNDQVVPLYTELKNGDRVEIKQKNGHPHYNWLNIVGTKNAKNKIKKSLKELDKDKNIALGRELLKKELGKNFSFDSDLINEIAKQENYSDQGDYSSGDALLAAIAYGDRSVNYIASKIKEKQLPADSIKPQKKNVISLKKPSVNHLESLEGMLYHRALCCQPLPGQEIIGITKHGGKGISIHASNCQNLHSVSPERHLTDIDWNDSKEQLYSKYIKVKVIDKPGNLHEITTILKELNINIFKSDISTLTKPEYQTAVIHLGIEVKDYQQYERVLANLKKIPNLIILD